MRIVLCLDYSRFTEKVLVTMQTLVQSLKECKISVIHIIDQTLFTGGTGFEIQLNEDLQNDIENLKKLSVQYLGKDINFIEEYGIPRIRIDEILASSDYDLLAIGSHSKSILGTRRIGSEAQHLLINSTKPVLIIP